MKSQKVKMDVRLHIKSPTSATAAEWQVTLCDPIWYVISRSGEMISITNCYIRFTLLYLLTFDSWATKRWRVSNGLSQGSDACDHTSKHRSNIKHDGGATAKAHFAHLSSGYYMSDMVCVSQRRRGHHEPINYVRMRYTISVKTPQPITGRGKWH